MLNNKIYLLLEKRVHQNNKINSPEVYGCVKKLSSKMSSSQFMMMLVFSAWSAQLRNKEI